MNTTTQRRNEYDIIVDSNGVAHLEILVEHGEGEIWAKISCLSRALEEITLYNGEDEVDIKSDVMANWIPDAKFRTIADIQELIEEIEMWRERKNQTDYEAIIESRNEAMAYDGPMA